MVSALKCLSSRISLLGNNSGNSIQRWGGGIQERNILQSFKFCFLNLLVDSNFPKEGNFLRIAAYVRVRRTQGVMLKWVFQDISQSTGREYSPETVLQSPANKKQLKTQILKVLSAPKYSITELLLVFIIESRTCQTAGIGLATAPTGVSSRPCFSAKAFIPSSSVISAIIFLRKTGVFQEKKNPFISQVQMRFKISILPIGVLQLKLNLQSFISC